MIMICNMCGTVHHSVSRADATARVSAAIRNGYEISSGQAPNIADYEYCSECGNSYTDFTGGHGQADTSACIIAEEITHAVR